ncbi:MAG: sulfatase [Planctomycetales bacterium]|nr:sulfatase [Planctomycetales bacterium]
MRLLAFFISVLAPAIALSADQPNIIFMLSDDQGWGGLSVAMHPDHPGAKSTIFHTPNIERLASQGMRFSSGYAPASVCSPTRISLQTGRSPASLHWTKAAPAEAGHKLTEPRLIKNIATNETTIGEILRDAGYATAHYGKWHIAGGGPEKHGYDESDGDTGNENAFQFKDPNPVDIFGMAERTEAFMAKCQKTGKPFFIQLSWNALHAAENALEATKAKYANVAAGSNAKRSSVAAITEDLDTGVGRVMESIDKLGLTDTTYVIYMSDNGAGGDKRTGLNGGKGTMWEGGIRVPFIVRGPGVNANSWCDVPVVGYDLYPTFCEWANVPVGQLPKTIEGGSIASLLANNGQGEVKRAREELVFHFPHYQSDDDGPHSAIRLGDLKLIHFYESDRDVLFDLSKDISEQNDLAAERPRDAEMLKKFLMTYLQDVNAQFATSNPDYDPNAEPVSRKGGKGGMKPTKPKGANGGRRPKD